MNFLKRYIPADINLRIKKHNLIKYEVTFDLLMKKILRSALEKFREIKFSKNHSVIEIDDRSRA